MQPLAGETSILIQTTPNELFDYLSDFSRHSEWVVNISKVTQSSPGPIQVGTTFKAQESAPPVATGAAMKMTFFFVAGLLSGAKPYSEAEITALEPNQRIAWQAGVRKGDGWFNRTTWEFVLEPQAAGTRLTQCFCYMPQNTLAERMIGVANSEQIAQACAVSLQRLKAIVEAKPVGVVTTDKVAKSF